MIERREAQDDTRPWIVVLEPTEAERAEFAAAHGVPESLLGHALDVRERPRIDQESGVTLVVLRTPRRMPAGSDVRWSTAPVSLILTATEVITVVPEITGFVDRVRKAVGDRCVAHRVVLAHLHVAAETFLEATAEVERAIDDEEARLAQSLGNREVLELVKLMKSLVHFTSALKSLELVVERLMKTGSIVVPEQDREALEDTLVELRQALETCNLERETLGATMDAFASVISNNLNDVMKLLAAVTVILTPPLAIAGYWGMNVPLPWSREPWAFVALLALSVLSSFLCALELRRRRWL